MHSLGTIFLSMHLRHKNTSNDIRIICVSVWKRPIMKLITVHLFRVTADFHKNKKFIGNFIQQLKIFDTLNNNN